MRQKPKTIAWLLCLPLCAGIHPVSSGEVGVHKCIASNGKVTYQDGLCPEVETGRAFQRRLRESSPSIAEVRTNVAAERRAGIVVTDFERQAARGALQRYLMASSKGDDDERCKAATEITAAMVSINEASQLKWSRHRDADCAAAREANRVAIGGATKTEN